MCFGGFGVPAHLTDDTYPMSSTAEAVVVAAAVTLCYSYYY